MFDTKICDLPDGATLHYVTDRREIDHVRNWAYNRPPDETRVEDIVKSDITDGVINVARVKGTDGCWEYVCYDGNHRREAFNRGAGKCLLVKVEWDATHETISRNFLRINKGVSVPELYLESEIGQDIRMTVLETVNRISSTFPSFCKPSMNPQRPHFNRDTLIDELTRAIQDGHMSHIDLYDQLMRMNDRIRDRMDFLNVPEGVKSKCRKTGCYLFCVRPMQFS